MSARRKVHLLSAMDLLGWIHGGSRRPPPREPPSPGVPRLPGQQDRANRRQARPEPLCLLQDAPEPDWRTVRDDVPSLWPHPAVGAGECPALNATPCNIS